MDFIDQLRTEVRIHGDMEIDFRSRRYLHAREIARKYLDNIEESARMAARNGNYLQLENGKVLISGFCEVTEKDFEQPFIQKEKKHHLFPRKRHEIYSAVPDNELFEVFLSAYKQLCKEEGIEYFPFQAQIEGEDGKILYHTLPLTLKKPKREKIIAFGFPYEILV